MAAMAVIVVMAMMPVVMIAVMAIMMSVAAMVTMMMGNHHAAGHEQTQQADQQCVLEFHSFASFRKSAVRMAANVASECKRNVCAPRLL